MLKRSSSSRTLATGRVVELAQVRKKKKLAKRECVSVSLLNYTTSTSSTLSPSFLLSVRSL